MVMIHFDGWNQRYDEWIEMDSEKLRPKTRHSTRKGRPKQSVRSCLKNFYLIVEDKQKFQRAYFRQY